MLVVDRIPLIDKLPVDERPTVWTCYFDVFRDISKLPSLPVSVKLVAKTIAGFRSRAIARVVRKLLLLFKAMKSRFAELRRVR